MIKLTNLSADASFRKLLGQKKINTDYFSIYFGKSLDRNVKNKLNISFIMKKKIGNSVVRNKIKRRLKSAVRSSLKYKKNINTNYSYLIFGKTKAYTEKYSTISNELYKSFFKINQMRK